MAQTESAQPESVSAADSQHAQHSLWRRWFGQGNEVPGAGEMPQDAHDPPQSEDEPRQGLIRRVSRKVVPGLPRQKTFKRTQAEVRDNLEPVQPTPAERRAVSVDRRHHHSTNAPGHSSNPRASAPDFMRNDLFSSTVSAPSIAGSLYEEKMLNSIGQLTIPEGVVDELPPPSDTASFNDAASMTTSQYDDMIHGELERIWILNLSMHFRDKSKREKFFVTYREKNIHWRRVTISLDYRGAPDNSLEMDLLQTRFQKDKSAKIYEAIRESLIDIQFYDSVTNLKLQTTDGRLHVHVVEDVNEIIHYPTTRMVQHLRCRRVKEREIDFEAHMSGFVYKVRVDGETLIKKEIPGPDTVDEFLYEINALSELSNSRNVIRFYGVVVDEYGENVKGLLISYAEQGALIDVIYEHDQGLSWTRREKWARQIVEGLSEIHEAGFVQGDFTLSNIVIDHNDNAKIIDCNRRGCPVGWEPPEATPLIESNQRISMYIGVKSDLYQLGMVLWALAEQIDEPEIQGRPLVLSEKLQLPEWYRSVVRICLADNPRARMQAIDLLRLFPARPEPDSELPSISVDDGFVVQRYQVDENHTGHGPIIKTVQAPSDWNQRSNFGHSCVESPTGLSNEPYFYPTRGRSPPSPMPSNLDHCEPRWSYRGPQWEEARGRSVERTRSRPGLGFAPDEMALESGESTDETAGEKDQVGQGLVPKLELAGDESVTPRPEERGTLFRESSKAPEEAFHLLQQKKRETEDRPKYPGPTTRGTDIHEQADTQDTASRGNGHGVHHESFLPDIDSTAPPPPPQHPLFQEAGTTEPEAPRTTVAALVPRAAEVQRTTSASTVLDTKPDTRGKRREDGVDSAVSLGPSVPDALLCLGSGHDAGVDAVRKGSASTIADDDLVGT